jgi:acetylornithine/N-succinyldiaminopimelate aminotransferase
MNMETTPDFNKMDSQYYLPVFKRFPVTLVKGRGSRVWDEKGNEYIDVMAGIAVNSIGHCHPELVKEITQQAESLIHISNFYLSKPQALLSKKLAEISGLSRVFLANSGAEANEGAIKIARKYAQAYKRGGHILSFSGCFHGRTLATIATGKKEMQKGFDPIPEGFKQLEFNNLEKVYNSISNKIAAIIVEPIQGEGGINIADKEFLQGLRKKCDEENILLIFDEIQCGLGRTGKYFAKDLFDVQPDILTSAKALGGGVPISAIITSEAVSKIIEPGDHGTTFGGNPLATAAALKTLEIIEKENLIQQAAEKGEWLKNKIKQNNPKKYKVREVRGAGLMIGIEFEFETKPLVNKMMENGVLANATAGNVLRFVPALNISYQDLEKVLEIMYKSIKEME